jgi:hypothetical protein
MLGNAVHSLHDPLTSSMNWSHQSNSQRAISRSLLTRTPGSQCSRTWPSGRSSVSLSIARIRLKSSSDASSGDLRSSGSSVRAASMTPVCPPRTIWATRCMLSRSLVKLSIESLGSHSPGWFCLDCQQSVSMPSVRPCRFAPVAWLGRKAAIWQRFDRT